MIHKHQHFDLLGKVVFERVEFTPPIRIVEALNSEACLLYTVKGKATLYRSDKKYSLETDDGLMIKCGHYFNHWNKNADASKNEAVAVHLYPDLIRHVYEGELPDFMNSDPNEQAIAVAPLFKNSFVKAYIDSLLPYFDSPSLIDEEFMVLKVREMLSMLYKMDSNNIRSLLHDMFNPLAYDFKKIVKAHIYEDLSIEELAHICNLSLSSFKRKFKEVFSNSPAAYIKSRRLEKAARLLRVDEKRIADIAFDCGFSSVDVFSRSFKKEYGMTPTAYKSHGLN